MHPIEAMVRSPVKVSVGVLITALFGVVAVLQMPMQLTPEVEVPVISVETRWPGASPMEIEQEIVREQEEQLKSVEGVEKMTSECMDSVATITLEFEIGTDMQEALLKVSNRLQQVPEYPEDTDQPVVSTSSSSDRPVAWFMLNVRMPSREQIQAFQKEHPELAEELEPVLRAHSVGLAEYRLRRVAEKHPVVAEQLLPSEIDVPTLRKFAEDYIEARFERVAGVSNSNVMGGREEELQVIVDPHKLAARKLTINDLRVALREHNLDTSAGDVWEQKRRYVVRTLGQFRSPEQVENLAIRVENGEPVYVRDVAEVRLGHKKPDGFVRRYGINAIAINAVRDTGANVFDVMEGLRKATEELNAGVLADRGLVLSQVYDETDYISSAVQLVNENIILGSALTIITLMLFLHSGWLAYFTTPLLAASALAALLVSPWFFLLTLAIIFVSGLWFARGALVVGLAIPISIVGTFLFMHQAGRSLNVISLAGLAFAVGMLVDNAVVVLENIYRHHHELRRKTFAAAIEGTKEVWGAVAASTLTTLAVFIPVLFVEEEAGQLFRDIALAISAAVGLSLIVAVTVIPAASARLLSESDKRHRQQSAQPAKAHPAAYIVRGIVAVNAWVLGSWPRKALVVATMVSAAVGLTYMLWPKVEYLPVGNRNLVIAFMLPPPGYNINQLGVMGSLVEKKLQPYWDVDLNSPEAAQLDYPVIEDFFYVARGRSVFLGLRSSDPQRVDDLLKLVDTLRPDLPGTILVANKSSLFDRGLTAGRTIDVEITGPDLRRLVGMGGMLMGMAMNPNPEQNPLVHVSQVKQGNEWVTRTEMPQARPIPSLDLSAPEIHVIPKMEIASEVGFSASELGYAVNALVDGAYASDYLHQGFQIDLTIMGHDKFVTHTQDIEGLPIATPIGSVVPVGAVAEVINSSGPEQVNHRERQRAITVQISPPPGIALEDAIQRIESQFLPALRESPLYGPEYNIMLSGTADKLNETWGAMKWNLLMAALITYLLMAALFESWFYPFVIMLSVPLGAVGGIVGLNMLNVYLQWQGQALQALDILTMLGFVILIGTVVNNPILIVHQSLNHMRDDGMPEREAILESVRTRVRPIFMTTSTTVFGLAPLVFFPGAGSELYRGLGSVVLGGLLMSTLFTLVLVPALFSLSGDVGRLALALVRVVRPARAAQKTDEDASEDEEPSAAEAEAESAEEPVAVPVAAEQPAHASAPAHGELAGNGEKEARGESNGDADSAPATTHPAAANR